VVRIRCTIIAIITLKKSADVRADPIMTSGLIPKMARAQSMHIAGNRRINDCIECQKKNDIHQYGKDVAVLVKLFYKRIEEDEHNEGSQKKEKTVCCSAIPPGSDPRLPYHTVLLLRSIPAGQHCA
jgi:hypothetical protein